MKRLIALAILFIAAVSFAGCGGGSSNGPLNATGSGTGRAIITMKWPQTGKASGTTRLVPLAANHVVVTLKRGSSVYGSPITFERPSSGSYTTTSEVDNLPLGNFTADALAYPDSNPVSIAQAKILGATFTVTNGQTAALNLTMSSTITALTVSAAGGVVTLAPAATVALSYVCTDAGSNNVLTSSTVTYASSAPTIATVNPTTGLVTGVSGGCAMITATDSESNVHGSITIMVPIPNPLFYFTDSSTNSLLGADDFTGTRWQSYNAQRCSNPAIGGCWGMARDSMGRIYLTSGNKIVRINDFSGAGYVALQSTSGHAISFPLGIAIDSQDRIYFADYTLNKIVRIDNIAGDNWTEYGTLGSSTGNFHEPTGIAVDSTFHIYIADYENHRVVKINTMTGTEWTALTMMGGQTMGQLGGIALDSSGGIYVTDYTNSRIYYAETIFNTTGASYGTSGSGPGQFNQPIGLTIGSDGKIYIADYFNHRFVRINNMAGGGWTTYGTNGTGTGMFTSPTAILVP